MGENPFLHSDLPFRLITSVWPLSEGQVALASFALLPMVLLIYSWHRGLLKVDATAANPDGHGLLSPINIYLLLLPALNYGIFGYYSTYVNQIARLESEGTLPMARASFVCAFTGPASWGLTLLGYGGGAALAVAAVRASGRTGISNWHTQMGRPTAISYWFHFWFFGVQLSIIFNWLLRHALVWATLNRSLDSAALDAYHPDGMLGLGAVGELTTWSFVVVALIVLVVVSWLAGARATLSTGAFSKNSGYVTATLALLVVGPVAVILPLTTAHDAMKSTRDAELHSLAQDVTNLARQLKEIGASPETTTEDLNQVVARLESQRALYDTVRESSVWPIARTTRNSLPLGLLSPALVPVFVQVGRKLARKLA